MQKWSCFIILAVLNLINQVSNATPWLTGPLLALPAQTIAKGHVTAYISVDSAISDAIYNQHWQISSQRTFTTAQISPQLAYGLTDNLDLQYNILYLINGNHRITYEHMGDTSIILGYQALSQQKNDAYPDLRITLQEVIPTGLYNNFTPANNGAEATGMGSYQTSLGFNFQYLSKLTKDNYLNSLFSMAYTYAGAAHIRGLSTYGGTSQTKGRINPGNAISFDIASELTLTQNWVAVIEANYIYQQASRFRGIVGERSATDPLPVMTTRTPRFSHRRLPTRHNIGQPDIGSGNLAQISLAPALEYNFSANYGVIAGTWLTLAGKNTPEFITPMIQFTATW